MRVWAAATAQAHPFLDEDFLQRERRAIRDVFLPRAETSVWEAGGRVAGFISLLGNEVGALFVEPEQQRNGIGRALMDHVRARGGSLEVEVFRDNPIGRAFYARYGFEPIEQKTHEPTGLPLLRLRLDSSAGTSDRMRPVGLAAHPEGGRFLEVFRSKATVVTEGGRSRSALTHIYFSLDPGEVSRFHRVSSDEVWNLYRGTGLQLYVWDGTPRPPDVVELSARASCFCHVVPAGAWQAARPIEGTVLVGCSVAPGFEFADFELMEPASDEARALRSADPLLSELIAP